jgi:hypothetical protein
LCSPCPSVRLSVRDFKFLSTRKCALCHLPQWVLSYIFPILVWHASVGTPCFLCWVMPLLICPWVISSLQK